MRATEAAKLKYEMKVIREGESYPRKPASAKTVAQLLKECRKPKDESCVEYFEMGYLQNGRRHAYAYVRLENSESFDEMDYAELAARKSVKKEETEAAKAERQRKKREAKNEEKRLERESALLLAARAFAGNAIVFDTETTGLSPERGDEILQISVSNKHGEALFSSYAKPDNKKSWHSAQQVHGITPLMVKDAPSQAKIASELKGMFEEADAIVGHNVSFDVRFANGCLGLNIPEEKVIDTMRLFRKDVAKAESHSLDAAVREYCPGFYGEFSGNAHDACMDARATAKVFEAIAKKGMALAKEMGIPIEREKEERYTTRERGTIREAEDAHGNERDSLLSSLLGKEISDEDAAYLEM